MASLCAARPSQLVQRFNPTTKAKFTFSSSAVKLTTRVCHASSNSRFKNTVTLQGRERLLVAFASNSSPPGGDSIKDTSDRITSNATQGPPLLTFLAGFLVFCIICWIFGSIIMWLFGLIVNVPPSK
ncbi:uncharacterized protein LOC105650332 [Jatropha curcas]|uniref:uncharacterized protein LOC105650332 n=1 Tax=Jatropha curcas TaxID=180498 RepID=UPI0005FB78E0|nr:uncharacterized protein LOC105650332 [Jatropha curcas]